MKKLLFLLLLISCNSKKVFKIYRVYSDTLIEVKTNTSYPVMLNLYISGNLDDTCIINQNLIPSGKVDTHLQIDHYHKDFKIQYQAYKAKKGSLTIRYKL